MQLPDGSLVMVCRIVGSIDGATLPKFEKKMLGFLEEGFKYLILIFSQVRYINSTGMGVLVKLADMFNEADGEINLVDVPEKLVALFNMLGLLALIKLSKTEEEALQQLKIRRNSGVLLPPASPAPTAPAPKSEAPAAPKPPPAAQPQKIPQPSPQSLVTKRKKPARVLLIKCRQCQAKISLGSQLKAGTYKCPRCMVLFKVLPDGKVEFLKI